MSDAKRPLEPAAAEAAAPAEPPTARQRSGDAEEEPKPSPRDESRSAVEAELSAKVGVQMRSGMRLEVRWVLEEGGGEAEGAAAAEPTESVPIWWACTLGAAAATADASVGREWTVRYDAMEERGFGVEERLVAFQSKELLVDTQTRRDSAGSGGGGEEGLMQWRVEGDSTEPPSLLQMGTRVKARWRGGEQYHAGRILGLNLDGTYKVDYADNQLELSVARDLIEVVELEAQVELSEEEGEADDGEVVMGSAAMFDLVIGRMVRGPAFSQLPADKQAAAAEQIAALKALFVSPTTTPFLTTHQSGT